MRGLSPGETHTEKRRFEDSGPNRPQSHNVPNPTGSLRAVTPTLVECLGADARNAGVISRRSSLGSRLAARVAGFGVSALVAPNRTRPVGRALGKDSNGGPTPTLALIRSRRFPKFLQTSNRFGDAEAPSHD